jgi:WD40-like Beta Propeller Repeat
LNVDGVQDDVSLGLGRLQQTEWRKAMKKLIWFGAMIFLLVPCAVKAQSAFNGTWKVNTNKVRFSKKPDMYVLENGVWHCKSCVPAINMKADGRDHPLPEPSACAETASVKVIDARTILITDRGKDGTVTATTKGTVSPDGKTLTFESTGTCNAKGEALTDKEVEQRVAQGPAGAHAISGSWLAVKAEAPADERTETIKVVGDSITDSSATGESFTAKFGGPSVLIQGDPDHETVAVRLISKNTLEMTYRINGKPVGRDRETVSSDGKTIAIVATDLTHNRTDRAVAEKQ